MPEHLNLAIQLLTLALAGLTSLLLAGVIWYGKRYIIEPVKRNTAARKYLLGDAHLDEVEDKGELEALSQQITDLELHMEQQHSVVLSHLKYLTKYVDNVASEINGDDIEPDMDRKEALFDD